MNAIRIRQQLKSHIVDLPELAPLIGKNVEIIVLEDVESSRTPASVDRPKAGSARGKVQMSADFDAPLDEFAEYT